MRTKEEILAEMADEFSKHPAIAELDDNNSAVSLWQQLKSMWVMFVQMLESRWEALRAEVDAKVSQARSGTVSWYVSQAMAFQLGDDLSVINGSAGYAVIDEGKRIIKQATATEDRATGRILIRVAKAGSGAEIIPLDAGEMAAMKEYIHGIKYAGVPIDVISIDADEVKIVAKIKVNPQLITTIGTSVSNPSKYPVLDAISEYLRAIPGNSVISWTALTDHLQALAGVRDFVVTETYIRRPGSIEWLPATSATESPAGHAVLSGDSILTYVV